MLGSYIRGNFCLLSVFTDSVQYVGVGAYDDPIVSFSVLRDVQGPSPTNHPIVA